MEIQTIDYFGKLENSTTNDKHPLLLPPDKLHKPVCSLCQRGPGRVRRRDSVQLKHGRRPSQRCVIGRCTVEDLRMGGPGVQGGVEMRVECHQAGMNLLVTLMCVWYPT